MPNASTGAPLVKRKGERKRRERWEGGEIKRKERGERNGREEEGGLGKKIEYREENEFVEVREAQRS